MVENLLAKNKDKLPQVFVDNFLSPFYISVHERDDIRKITRKQSENSQREKLHLLSKKAQMKF